MLGKILLVVVAIVVLVAACVFFYIGPRNVIGILTYGQQARDGDLKVGDDAPIVALVGLDASTPQPLSNWIGDQPLVLVFGSFT